MLHLKQCGFFLPEVLIGLLGIKMTKEEILEKSN